MKHLSLFLLLSAGVFAFAQQPVSQPNAPRTTTQQIAQPVAQSAQSGVASAQSPLLLSQLEQAAQNANIDTARLRIDKWKADGDTKRQASGHSQSIQRNITNALPVLMNEVRQQPESIAATFKLYRNVKALYDEFATLAEYAGAFGAKDDYKTLGTDAQNFDSLARSMADRVDALASQADTTIAQLRSQAAQARANGTQNGPKKIIVDDNAPVKKTTKKKSTKTPPPPSD
jgi:hypothetical protein